MSNVKQAFWKNQFYNKIAIGLDLATLKTGMAIATYNIDQRYYCLEELLLFQQSTATDTEQRMENISVDIWKRLRRFVGVNLPYTEIEIGIEMPFIVEAKIKNKDKIIQRATEVLIGMSFLVRNRINKLINDPNNLHIKVHMIQNLRWKHYLCGNGDAEKEDVITFASNKSEKIKRCYEEHKNQDMIDAYGVLLFLIESEDGLHEELKVL